MTRTSRRRNNHRVELLTTNERNRLGLQRPRVGVLGSHHSTFRPYQRLPDQIHIERLPDVEVR